MGSVERAELSAEQAKVRSEVKAAIEGGETARAGELVDEALARWPRDYGLRMQKGEVLQRSHKPADAIELYLRLGREEHAAHWPLLRAVRLLCDGGNVAQARNIFASEIWSGPAPEDVKLRGLAWLVADGAGGESAEAFFKRLEPEPGDEALAKLADMDARRKDGEARAAETAAELAKARSEIKFALDGGETARAGELVEEALGRWPLDYGLRMQKGEVLQRSHKPADAIELYLRLGREGHEGHWPLLRAVRLLLDGGELARARDLFETEIWSGPAPEDVKLRGLAWLATAADESETVAAFLERLVEAAAPAPAAEALAKLAELRARQGREERAREALARIGVLGAAPLRARAVEADLMLADGKAADMLPIARKLAADEPDRIEHARRLVLALATAGETQAAADVLSKALEQWPGDWILLMRFNTMPAQREQIANVVDLVTRRTDPASLPEISRFQFVMVLLNLRRTEEALRLLESIDPDGATGFMANPLRRIIEMMPAETWSSRTRLYDDRAAGIQVVPSPRARAAILVFGGTTGGHSHLPFSYLDALLADVSAHVVYVRDTSGRGFLGDRRNPDNPQARTVAELRRVLADLAVDRVVAIGASIGGHAAARIGAELGVDAVALMSAPTSFDTPPIQGERASPYNRLYRIRKMSKALASRVAGADLLDIFAGYPKTRNFFYFGEGTERGERNAARLRGIDNVVLRSLPVADHTAVPLEVIGTRHWDELLYEDLRVGG